MYGLEIKPEADRIFKRLSKKDKHHLQRIYNKIREIQENPQIPHKFLHSPLQNYERVSGKAHDFSRGMNGIICWF